MIEQEVCLESEVQDGKMKQVEFGSGKILLTKHEGKISAVSGKCTHYGAPLITGAYKNGKVRCPWHGACFSTTTGDIEDFPGLDSLHKYEVAIKNGKVIVKGNEQAFNEGKLIKVDTNDQVNQAVSKWFKRVRAENVSVSVLMIKEKALLYAKELKFENLQASEGWLEKWKKTLKDFRRVKDMVKNCPLKEIILVLGGDDFGFAAILFSLCTGGSAMAFCETLRQQGYEGQILMATQEKHVPYDRPKLSKMLNSEASKLYLRTPEFLKEKNIEIMYNKKAILVDTKDKIVGFEDGTTQSYNKLYVATGGKPKLLKVPGNDLENIFYLRSPEDANAIDQNCPEKDIVILGTGFIALELASYFVSKSKSVTVVGSGCSKLPFQKLLGEKVAKMYYQQHKDKGVRFSLEHPVKEVSGQNGKVSGVILENGERISADVVLVGIGVTPSTEFLQNTEINMTAQGQIIVDKYMKTTIVDIYAGGDVAMFPYCYNDGEMINIGHWQLASYHGRCAALNMLGKTEACTTVPFFWTGQYGKSLRYSGYCSDFDDIVYDGNVENMKFSAYYFKGGKMRAVASMNMGAKASEVAFAIKDGCTPTIEQLRKQTVE